MGGFQGDAPLHGGSRISTAWTFTTSLAYRVCPFCTLAVCAAWASSRRGPVVCACSWRGCWRRPAWHGCPQGHWPVGGHSWAVTLPYTAWAFVVSMASRVRKVTALAGVAYCTAWTFTMSSAGRCACSWRALRRCLSLALSASAPNALGVFPCRAVGAQVHGVGMGSCAACGFAVSLACRLCPLTAWARVASLTARAFARQLAVRGTCTRRWLWQRPAPRGSLAFAIVGLGLKRAGGRRRAWRSSGMR